MIWPSFDVYAKAALVQNARFGGSEKMNGPEGKTAETATIMTAKHKVVLVGFFVGAVYFTYYVCIRAVFIGNINIGLNRTNRDSCPNVARVLTVHPMGNLGNIIWEYMSLYAVTKLYTEKYFVSFIETSMKETLESIFERLTITTVHNFIDEAANVKVLRKDEPVTAKVLNNDCSSLLLDEYSARYEDVIRLNVDNIRKELRFKASLVEKVTKTMDDARRHFGMDGGNVTYVGIHYRGTDYIHHLQIFHGDKFKGPPDHRYYVRAMDYFKELYENVIFFLITIDYRWLKKNEPFLRNKSSVVVNPYREDPIRDLVLLSHCNHSIINYGTYGVTAAFLNKGTTIVYDLQLPLDHRGQTVAMGISGILDNWCTLPRDNSTM